MYTRRAMALGRLPTGVMNRTESKYAQYLENRKLLGEIIRYDFEPESLRLAKGCVYMPDFRVQLANGELEFHEVKGYWMDDAKVKVKVAAQTHPYRFIAVYYKKGEFTFEEIKHD